MPNPVYTYDLWVNCLLVTLFLHKPELICLHTDKWFQVLLSNTNSSNCTHLGFNHSKWLNSSIWPIDGILTDITTPGQSGPGSNGNEELLHSLQSSRTGVSPSAAVYCLTLNPHYVEVLLLCRDVVSVFSSLSQLFILFFSGTQSNQIWIIFKLIDLTHRCEPQTGTAIPSQNGPENYGHDI